MPWEMGAVAAAGRVWELAGQGGRGGCQSQLWNAPWGGEQKPRGGERNYDGSLTKAPRPGLGGGRENGKDGKESQGGQEDALVSSQLPRGPLLGSRASHRDIDIASSFQDTSHPTPVSMLVLDSAKGAQGLLLTCHILHTGDLALCVKAPITGKSFIHPSIHSFSDVC